jgi:hypothetical protein
MKLARSSLCGILLEQGEENLAVLIARADLPEVLDSARDAPALATLGLGEQDLRDLLPAVSGDLLAAGAASTKDTAELSRTISDRWAHLVSVWTGTWNGTGTHP